MKKSLFSTLLLGAAVFSLTSLSAQSLKVPAASPAQTIRQDFALSSIEINYSRPAMKGRTIFGDLVPFGKLWRTGANGATTIQFGEDVRVNGIEVKAGKYALYTIPDKNSWEVILNKGTANWGIDGYTAGDDVARFKVTPAKLPFKTENFTIVVDNVSGGKADITLIWDDSKVSMNIVSEIDSKITSQINEVMMQDKRPYFQAANYYYENDKDLNQALEWASKAIDQNPNAFWVVHLKAKIQAKMGDKKGAKATADQSIKLAQAAGNNDYVALNLKLIDSLK